MKELREKGRNQKKGLSIFSFLLMFMMLFSATMVQAKTKTTKPAKTYYGNVSGAITWQYTGSTDIKVDNHTSLYFFSSKAKKADFKSINAANFALGSTAGTISKDVYYSVTDNNGKFSLKKIPTGTYKVVIVSGNMGRPNSEDITQTSEYKFLSKYLMKDQLDTFTGMNGMKISESTFKTVSIAKNKTVKLNYAFK